MHTTIKRGRGPSTPMQVYFALRDAIVRVELAPGQRLSENELAAGLGVSRTPIREALARLRDERLVEVVPQIGTFVSQISAEAVGDAQFVREALECAAIRRAAVLATEDDIRALEENLRSQDRANENDDVEAFYALDDALHQSLCDLSRHPTVWSISQRAKSHLNRVRRLSLGMPDYLASMIEEHRQVVAAFAARDPELAEVSLRYHLRQVLRELPRIREEHPEFFAEV